MLRSWDSGPTPKSMTTMCGSRMPRSTYPRYSQPHFPRWCHSNEGLLYGLNLFFIRLSALLVESRPFLRCYKKNAVQNHPRGIQGREHRCVQFIGSFLSIGSDAVLCASTPPLYSVGHLGWLRTGAEAKFKMLCILLEVLAYPGKLLDSDVQNWDCCRETKSSWSCASKEESWILQRLAGKCSR